MATTTSTPFDPTLDTREVITWQAFEHLPDSNGLHREIVEGILQVLPPAKLRHSEIAKRIFKALMNLDNPSVGEALFEAGYKLSNDPPSWIQPDVSFISAAQIDESRAAGGAMTGGAMGGSGMAGGALAGYAVGAPLLAVEVVSPSETATDLQRKIKLLLAGGSLAVWVVYPDDQSIEVHLPDGTAFTRGTSDSLDAPFLLQGWSIEVSKLFE